MAVDMAAGGAGLCEGHRVTCVNSHGESLSSSAQITILLKDVTFMTKEKTAKLIPNAIQISTDNEKVKA